MRFLITRIMIDIKRYTAADKMDWDKLIEKSRLDSFLFYRDFMDYHAHRYLDCSFLIYRKGKLEAVLPGNLDENTFISHQGLTYGGLVTTQSLTTKDILAVFCLLNTELNKYGVSEVIYKPAPFIYQLIPSQEDIYALFINNAVKIGCNISSSIFQGNKPRFNESRKSGIRKAKREGLTVVQSDEYEHFWYLLEENLQLRHSTKPVHSITEILDLRNKFPKNIMLYTALLNNNVIAGTLLFVMKNVIHVQYISSNVFGKESGALDFLFDELINRIYTHIPYFDFGHSTEQMGRYLNEKLIFQKESFGARGVVYDTYRYKI